MLFNSRGDYLGAGAYVDQVNRYRVIHKSFPHWLKKIIEGMKEMICYNVVDI